MLVTGRRIRFNTVNRKWNHFIEDVRVHTLIKGIPPKVSINQKIKFPVTDTTLELTSQISV